MEKSRRLRTLNVPDADNFADGISWSGIRCKKQVLGRNIGEIAFVDVVGSRDINPFPLKSRQLRFELPYRRRPHDQKILRLSSLRPVPDTGNRQNLVPLAIERSIEYFHVGLLAGGVVAYAGCG